MTETLTLHAYEWITKDHYTDTDGLEIHAWTLDRESNPCLLRLKDFPVFCHVELPCFINNRYFRWNRDYAFTYYKWLCNQRGDRAPFRMIFEEKSKMYYYRSGKKFPMLVLLFKSIEDMTSCEYFLSRPRQVGDLGLICAKVWETSISPVRKLLSNKEIGYSQWFSVNAVRVDKDEKVSTTEMEYFGDWRSMRPIAPEDSKSWSTHPRLLAFDIETYSDNHKALPNRYNTKHVVYMISLIYQRLGYPDTRKRYALIYGDCDPIPGSEIIRVNSEIDLINEMSRIVNELDPEILMGYNILGYDYPYMDARLQRRLHDWKPMGRLINEPTRMNSKSWKSSAYGYNEINDLLMDGRISIDMLQVIKRDYKLPKYDLDTVSKVFIGRGKHPVKAQEMFRIYEENQAAIASEDEERIKNAKSEMTRVMAYCLEDSELVVDMFEKLHMWIGMIELSNIVGVTMTELFTGGQQRRCVSQIYNLASRLHFVLDKRDMGRVPFSGGFVYEPIPGLYENIVCLDFASLYPSIMEAYNICFTTLVPPELMDQIPDEKCWVFKWEEAITKDKKEEEDSDDGEDGEAGDDDDEAGEEETKPVKYATYHYKFIKQEYHRGILPQLVHELVAQRNVVRKLMGQLKEQASKLDEGLKQLRNYPNLSHMQILHLLQTNCNQERERLTELSGFEKDTLEGEIKKLTKAIAAIEEAIRRGDQTIEDTINHDQPIIKDLQLQCVVLDKRQLALKVSANSMFGFLGVQNGGKMPLIEGAMCITSKGRELIGLVNNHLQSKYGALVVYNDTDSSMVDLKINDPREVYRWGIQLSQEISGKPAKYNSDGVCIEEAVPGLFPPPLRMEFEKGMRLLCIRKKKYIAALIDKYGRHKLGKKDILVKGVLTARRDNCQWVRDVYDKIVNCVLHRKPMVDVLDIIVDSVQKLLANQVDPKDLSIIKGLGANYKSSTYFMKVFSDELRKIGKPVTPGDRLEYVIVKPVDGEKPLLGKQMRLLELYQESPTEPIDIMYYLEKVLTNPIEQLWKTAYKKELESMQTIGYKPRTQHKFVPISNPIKMIIRLINDGIDVASIKHLLQPQQVPRPLRLKIVPSKPKLKLKIVPSNLPIMPLTGDVLIS
jgi:DNA polymerase elongation subunit (family B)